jgi:uncharacterized protein
MAGIPKRSFGKTNDQISALGLGGHHLGDAEDETIAARIVHEAIDGGITFFDNCWEYNLGKSENWMGRALRGRRDQVFLMTKVCTHGRDASLGLEMLEQSLRRLQTDHLDLWQIHGVSFDNDRSYLSAEAEQPKLWKRLNNRGKCGTWVSLGINLRICISRCLRLDFPSMRCKCR